MRQKNRVLSKKKNKKEQKEGKEIKSKEIKKEIKKIKKEMEDEEKVENKKMDLNCVLKREVERVSCRSDGEWHFMMTLEAPLFEREKRANLDLVAVIDKSGSMQGSKIDLVKKTIKFICTQLSPSDRLCIVSYSTRYSVDMILTKMDEAGKQHATSVIESIHADHYTNLCGGLVSGIHEILNRDNDNKNEVSSVLLLTDGHANEGYTGSNQILMACKDPSFFKNSSGWFDPQGDYSKAIEEFPCSINTFGYGSDHSPTLLQDISTAANGVYYYIENDESIPESFASCLGGLLSVVAQNISLTFEALNETKDLEILNDFPQKKLNSGELQIQVGDIQSEETRNVMGKVLLPSLDADWPSNWKALHARLEYFNVISSSFSCSELSITVDRPSEEEMAKSDPPTRNFDVDKNLNRLASTKAMKEATLKALGGNMDDAQTIIKKAINQIEESISTKDPLCIVLVKDLDACLDSLKSRYEFSSHGHHMMSCMSSGYTYERSTYTQSPSYSHYTTSSRQESQQAAAKYFS